MQHAALSGSTLASKETVAEALDDAFAVVNAINGARRMPTTMFIQKMVEKGVTVTAAQDSLRFLEGTGAETLDTIGEIIHEERLV